MLYSFIAYSTWTGSSGNGSLHIIVCALPEVKEGRRLILGFESCSSNYRRSATFETGNLKRYSEVIALNKFICRCSQSLIYRVCKGISDLYILAVYICECFSFVCLNVYPIYLSPWSHTTTRYHMSSIYREKYRPIMCGYQSISFIVAFKKLR